MDLTTVENNPPPAGTLKLAEAWHGGQESMLYALASTGTLRLSRHEGEGDAERLAELCEALQREALRCRMLAESPEYREGSEADIVGLNRLSEWAGAQARACRAIAKGKEPEREIIAGVDVHAMAASYLATAEWDNGDETDDNGDAVELEAWSDDAQAKALDDCRKFLTKAAALIALIPEAYTDTRENQEMTAADQLASNLGHDLWLTQSGAGVGFWDREALEDSEQGETLGEALSKLCEGGQRWVTIDKSIGYLD